MQEIQLKFKSLGAYLRYLRIRRMLTQEELAKKLHVRRQHYQRWEYNLCRPRPRMLKEICNMLQGNYNIALSFYLVEYKKPEICILERDEANRKKVRQNKIFKTAFA